VRFGRPIVPEDRSMLGTQNLLPCRTKRGTLLGLLTLMTLVLLLLSGCALPTLTLKPLLEEEGEVQVYLQPFSPEADHLKFSIDSMSLVGSDGSEIPLSLAMTEFRPGEMQRQRFVAVGRIQPGNYSGLSLRVSKATLSKEGEELTLSVPKELVMVPLSVAVRRKKIVVLALSFQFSGSVQSGSSFAPRFSLSVPTLPVSGLLGYVVNRADNTLTVFDKRTGLVAAVLATGRDPEQVVFDQDARTAYLTVEGEDAVLVLDMTDGEVVHRINLKIGDGPTSIALTPDRKSLLTVNTRSRTLSIIDPVSLTERARVPVGEGPRWLLVDWNGTRCYVLNGLDNTMTVIDIVHSAVVATVATDAGPLMAQFSRKGDRLYVVHENSPYLLVFDPLSLSVSKRMFFGYGVEAIKVDPTSDLLYASRKGEGPIEVYETFSLNLMDHLPGGSDVVQMTIDGEANNLFLLCAGNRLLRSVSLVNRKTVSETDLGEDPSWVTLMGER
jgi:YVTN family beta-propeller protein